MARLSSELILSLVDRVTGPARAISGRVEKMQGRIDKNSAAMGAMHGAMLRTAAAATGLAYGIAKPVQAAMEFESAMADVRKVVDFPAPDGLEKMGADLIAMSKEIPIAATGLAEIAAAAGQAGIAAGDITAFTESAAKIGVAFDISAGEAGDALAGLRNIFKISTEDAVLLTDAMNHLSNSQASTAPDILNVVQRVGAQGTQMGFAASETTAFASAMLAAKVPAEVAATSFRNMGLALTAGESATKRQVTAMEKLGLKSEDVAKRMQEDAVETTLDVLDRLAALPAEVRASVSMDLFGREARGLGTLMTNTDLLRGSLELVADETEYAGSAFREYEIRSQTFANSVQLFGNRLEALKIVIGASLIPSINDLMDKLSPVIDSMATWAAENPELIATIVEATAALIAFRISLLGLRFLGLLGKGGALWFMASGLKAVGVAAGAVTLLPLSVAVAALAGAAWWAYNRWDRLEAIFRGVGRAVSEILEPAIEKIQPIIDAMTPGLEAAARAFDWLKEAIGGISTREILSDEDAAAVEQRAYEFVYKIQSVMDRLPQILYGIGEAAIMRLLDGMKAKFADLMEWVRTIPGEIAGAVGDITPWNRGSDPSGLPPTSPLAGRELGGPVRARVPYVVGEKRAEVFVPDVAGRILPQVPTARPVGASGGRAASADHRSTSITFGDIILPPGSSGDPDALARAFGREAAALLRSSYADPY